MKKVSLLAVVVFAVFTIGNSYSAEKPKTPESLDGATVVDADWVMANKNEVTIYDVRSKEKYDKGHVPGAISVPYKENSEKHVNFDASLDEFDLSKFPVDKGAGIVTQCSGAT